MSRTVLVLPRLFLGVIFAIAVSHKLAALGAFPAMMAGFVHQGADNQNPLYASFANAVILPNAKLFAGLVVTGECCVAVSMLLGLATRAGAAVAVVLCANYMLAKGMTLWSPASNDAADIILAIVVGAGAAGRAFGVDALLARRWPKSPFW